MFKSALYKIYNSLPVFLRKFLYAIYFAVFHKLVVQKQTQVKKNASGFKAFSLTLLKINLVGFVIFAIAGLAFYLDGVHQSSALISLTSNFRVEFILISFMLASCIHYSKRHFKLNIQDTKSHKGGKYVSYNKK